jgi:hypothetical protein
LQRNVAEGNAQCHTSRSLSKAPGLEGYGTPEGI